MKIKDIMSKSVVSVDLDDTLRKIKTIFDHTQFHHLLVVNRDKLLGIISDRDLLKSLNPNIDTINETHKDTIILNKKAHQIMSRETITLLPEDSIPKAIEIFNQHKISCIPIIDKNNKPIGILSWRDILKVLMERYNTRQTHD